MADYSTTEKAAVVRLIIQNVIEAGRRTGTMAASGVVKPAVGIDPKHELWDAVGEISNRRASASVVWSKEIEPLGGLLS